MGSNNCFHLNALFLKAFLITGNINQNLFPKYSAQSTKKETGVGVSIRHPPVSICDGLLEDAEEMQ
jgi:hypothetical protein